MILVLAGFSCRPERAGVTSLVRLFGFGHRGYRRFLHLFHSRALELDALTACWVRLCLRLFQPVAVGERLVCLADGIKAPKEGRKMPAVKRLHQQSASNSKPEYIMGHSFQAVSLLIRGLAGHVASVPLVSRIHEGLVWSNRDTRTLLDKLALQRRVLWRDKERFGLRDFAFALHCGSMKLLVPDYASPRRFA
jgi:hypothetical protein